MQDWIKIYFELCEITNLYNEAKQNGEEFDVLVLAEQRKIKLEELLNLCYTTKSDSSTAFMAYKWAKWLQEDVFR